MEIIKVNSDLLTRRMKIMIWMVVLLGIFVICLSSVSAGTFQNYSLVLHSDLTGANGLNWKTSDENPYPNGTSYYSEDNGTTWTQVITNDDATIIFIAGGETEIKQTTSNNNRGMYAGRNYLAQTISLDSLTNVAIASLLIWRDGTAGNLDVFLTEINSTGSPDMNKQYLSGSMDASGVTTNSAGQWYNITLASNHTSKYFELTNVLNSPANNSYSISIIPFQANFTAYSGNVTNATLYVYNSDGTIYNNTVINIITGTSNSTTLNFYPAGVNKFYWNVYGCGANSTFYNCTFASTNRTFNFGFVENNITYNATSTASNYETYSINLTYNSTLYPTIAGYLVYNGVPYLATRNGIGNQAIFTKSLVTDTSGTYNFYWDIIMTTSGGISYHINSTTNSQILYGLVPLVIQSTPCGAGFNSTYIFHFADEVSKLPLTANISYNFNYGISSYNTNTYGNQSNIADLYICLNSTTPDYQIGSAEVDYSITGYTDRKYYLFTGTRIGQTTTNITTYSLPTALSTSFLFTIEDNLFNPQTNSFLAILRWYPELNNYNIVEMGKADNKGQTVGRVKTEDVDYRIGVYTLNGTLVKLYNPIRFVCSATPCTYSIVTPAPISSYYSIDSLQHSLTYNSTSKVFTYVWSDPSQQTTAMNLTVYRDAYDSTTIICSVVGAGFIGLIQCDVSAYNYGTARAVVYRSASPLTPIASLLQELGRALTDISGGKTMGLFMSFILFTFAFLAGMYNPILAMILGIVALIPAVFVGAISISVLIGLVLLAWIMIHFLRRS